MKVVILLTTETSYSITIPDNSTVEDLRNSAKVACPPDSKLPTDFKLIYNGQKLEPYYKTLDTFHMKPELENITVILMNSGTEFAEETSIKESISVPVPAKKAKTKKNRCSFKTCNSAPLRMVGNCSHCQGKFCAKHRLLEDHLCQALQFCKDSAHERNAMKLQSESTITSKV